MQDSPNPEKRGPAPFAPTKAQRRDVTLFAAAGMAEPGIAAAIGICQNTLRKHFAAELLVGRETEMAENLKRLRKAADKGNVTAMKHLDARFGRAAAEAVFQPAPPAEPKIGKKEEASRAAETAGQNSEWGGDLVPPSGLPN